MLTLSSTITTQSDSPNGVRYSDQLKELAYQLWAFVAGRSTKEVVRTLASGEYGESVDVHRNTVDYWAREYKWTDRAEREIQAIAPNLRHQAFSELLFAGLDGAKYIRRVASGLEDHPNIDDIVNDESLNLTDKHLRIDAKLRAHDAARKTRSTVSIAAVDRIGFSPIGKGAPGVDAPNGQLDQPDFNTMTIAQLREYELSKRKPRPT